MTSTSYVEGLVNFLVEPTVCTCAQLLPISISLPCLASFPSSSFPGGKVPSCATCCTGFQSHFFKRRQTKYRQAHRTNNTRGYRQPGFQTGCSQINVRCTAMSKTGSVVYMVSQTSYAVSFVWQLACINIRHKTFVAVRALTLLIDPIFFATPTHCLYPKVLKNESINVVTCLIVA